MTRAVCVCVPARNEADRLPALLDALARQAPARPLRVALCVNNSDDGSAEAALARAAASPSLLALDVIEVRFERRLAHAGSARRAAMDRGAELLAAAAGVLVSTDADCRPPPGWIDAILSAVEDDDVVVGGRIVLDEQEPLDARVLALRRRWDRYWAKVREIEDALDPIPWDPPPRHGDHTGASLALTVGLYRRSGGVPLTPTGEDLGLVEAAISVGGRLVHPAPVWTRVSGRTVGRAAGGMAAEMERLAACAGSGTAPMVPAFSHWRDRAAWRRAARGSLSAAQRLRAERSLPPATLDMPLPALD